MRNSIPLFAAPGGGDASFARRSGRRSGGKSVVRPIQPLQALPRFSAFVTMFEGFVRPVRRGTKRMFGITEKLREGSVVFGHGK